MQRLGRWLIACKAIAAFAICLILAAAASAYAESPLRAGDYKMSGDTRQMQVELAFDRDPSLNWFLLRGPYRLVVDLPQTQFVFEPGKLKAKGMISAVRYGDVGEGRSRLILTSKKPFKIGKVDVTANATPGKYLLKIDLASASSQEFDAALAEQAQTTSSTVAAATAQANASQATEKKRFTVVIDPGHGGIDGGAKGVNGTSEKVITLTFGKELRKRLEETGRYDVLLTRSDDEFIRLDDRVKFARLRHADLFISVHADTIRLKGIRGATVYTVSDEASDAEAAALADRENLSDQVAGIEMKEDNQEVTDILVDLIRRETHSFSVNFARSLVGELSSITGLINNPHRHAGFRVLRAPDVPSVLVELGYLSNASDEKQLLDPEWRGKAADSIVKAVDAFAATKVSAQN